MSSHYPALAVLGPRKLPNRLLCEHLCAATGLQCLDGHSGDGLALALVDFDEEGRYLAKPMGHARPGVWALFNVPEGRGVEKGAFAAGYRGFFYRSDDSETFTKGVRTLAAGEYWISRRVLTECLSSGHHPGRRAPELTAREREIISLIASGLPNEKIGRALNISPFTVKTHTYRIFRKIGVSSRLQAAKWAASNVAPAFAD